MNLDIKLKFNFNKRNRYKNICSIEDKAYEEMRHN